MTDKPIIFSAPMVRALLDGRKSQTRRIIKINGMLPDFCGGRGDLDDPTCWGWEDPDHGDWVTLEKEPAQRMGWRDWRGAYRSGDRLWVREAFATWENSENDGGIDYRATRQCNDVDRGWKPSIHMPRWASRLTLTVTDVRVQWLQEISEADARAEGAAWHDGRGLGHSGWRHDLSDVHADARSSFARLWNSIHGPDAWAANPWVVALTFDVHRCNIDSMGQA